MPKGKIQMNIEVAGEHFHLTVPFEEQNRARDIERGVNRLYNHWRVQYSGKSDKHILAMVAYQYASYYADMRQQRDEASAVSEDISRILDELLKSSKS